MIGPKYGLVAALLTRMSTRAEPVHGGRHAGLGLARGRRRWPRSTPPGRRTCAGHVGRSAVLGNEGRRRLERRRLSRGEHHRCAGLGEPGAMAWPMPREPPVTSAVFPSSRSSTADTIDSAVNDSDDVPSEVPSQTVPSRQCRTDSAVTDSAVNRQCRRQKCRRECRRQTVPSTDSAVDRQCVDRQCVDTPRPTASEATRRWLGVDPVV